MTYKYNYGSHVGEFYPYVGDPPGSVGYGQITNPGYLNPVDQRPYTPLWTAPAGPYKTYTTDYNIKLNTDLDQYKIGYRDGFKDGYNTAFEVEGWSQR